MSARSPLGQRTRFNTNIDLRRAARTLALDPARVRLPENDEQPIDMFYASFTSPIAKRDWLARSGDAVDGNPDKFLKRDVTFILMAL